MNEKLLSLKDEIKSRLGETQDLTDLDKIRVSYLGKKGSITALLKGMKDLPNEERKTFGAEVNKLKAQAAQLIEERLAELKEKEREISSLEAEIAASKTADLMKDAKQIGGVRLVTADIGEAGADALRSLCDKALESGDDIIAVFAGKNAEKGTASFACRVGKKAIECGAHAGNIVREVARVAGGAGGGKPDSAMAGAKDVSKIPEALKKASEIVAAMLLGKR